MPNPADREGGGRRGAEARARSLARLAAVQALYQREMSGGDAETLIREFLLHRGGPELGEGDRRIETDRELFGDLVRGVSRNQEELDRMISGVLVAGWPIDRIEKVMLAILRAGAFELLERAAVPARVAISEYVDIADAFLGAREVGMVNGVLDRLARILREAEMGSDPGDERDAPNRSSG